MVSILRRHKVLSGVLKFHRDHVIIITTIIIIIIIIIIIFVYFKLTMKIGYKFKYVKVIAFPKIKSKAN